MRIMFVGMLAAAWLVPFAVMAQEAAQENPLIVQEMTCRGNTSTSCYFILSHLQLKAGDPVNEEEIQNAKLRLSSLPNFESVDVFLERGTTKGQARVVVDVKESDPIATELTVGLSARLSSLSQKIAGRVSHQNLFGTGKILDLSLLGRIPLERPEHRAQYASLRYIDPRLGGSSKNFMIASLAYGDSEDEYTSGDFEDHELTAVGVAFGRRVQDLGYVTAGYRYRSQILNLVRKFDFDGDPDTEIDTNPNELSFEYGWSSEDDFYFPTRGFSFAAGTSLTFGATGEDRKLFANLQLRKSWQSELGIWSVKVGAVPGPDVRSSFDQERFDESEVFSIAFARALKPGDTIKRGRWYLQPGVSSGRFDARGDDVLEARLKLGVRLDTKSFGIIDLYLSGSTNVDGGLGL